MEVIPIWPFTSTQHTIKNRCLNLPAKEHRVFTYKYGLYQFLFIIHSTLGSEKETKKKKLKLFEVKE